MSDLDLPYCHGNLHRGQQKWAGSANCSPPELLQDSAELEIKDIPEAKDDESLDSDTVEKE